MSIHKKRICCAAAAIAASSIFAFPALGQTLALSYQLEVQAQPRQSVPAAAHRCAGVNWMTGMGTCGREMLARIKPAPRQDGADASYAGAGPREPDDTGATPALAVETRDTAAARTEAIVVELPALGGSAPAGPRLRSAGVREAPPGSSRTADLLLRLGSNYRFKGNDEGPLDWYRFTDTAYQTHLQNNGHKALGVELLVPFQ